MIEVASNTSYTSYMIWCISMMSISCPSNTWDFPARHQGNPPTLKDPDLAHTADVFCWLKATSSGWVEGSKCQKELQLIIERGLTTQQILDSRRSRSWRLWITNWEGEVDNELILCWDGGTLNLLLEWDGELIWKSDVKIMSRWDSELIRKKGE